MIDLSVLNKEINGNVENYMKRLWSLKTTKTPASSLFMSILYKEIQLCGDILNAKKLNKSNLENIFSLREIGCIEDFRIDLNKSARYVQEFISELNSIQKEIERDEEGANKAIIVANTDEKVTLNEFESISKVLLNEMNVIRPKLSELTTKIEVCSDAIESLYRENEQMDLSVLDFVKRFNLFIILNQNYMFVDSKNVYDLIQKYRVQVHLKKEEAFNPIKIIRNSSSLKRFFAVGFLGFLMNLFPISASKTNSNINDLNKNTNTSSVSVKSENITPNTIKGLATYYADSFDGHPTISGVTFYQNKISCAVPAGSEISPRNAPKDKKGNVMLLLIKSVKNGKTLIVPAFDTGNFGHNKGNTYKNLTVREDNIKTNTTTKRKLPRILDLSKATRDYLRGNLREDNLEIEYYSLGWVTQDEAIAYSNTPSSYFAY